MPFRVSGKNLDIEEALRRRVNARIAEALSKRFHGGYSGHVTVAREGFGFRTECAMKRLPVSEAVLELDITGASVIVFRHAGHGRINVVYRRADGHIGWIDPPPMTPGDGH